MRNAVLRCEPIDARSWRAAGDMDSACLRLSICAKGGSAATTRARLSPSIAVGDGRSRAPASREVSRASFIVRTPVVRQKKGVSPLPSRSYAFDLQVFSCTARPSCSRVFVGPSSNSFSVIFRTGEPSLNPPERADLPGAWRTAPARALRPVLPQRSREDVGGVGVKRLIAEDDLTSRTMLAR